MAMRDGSGPRRMGSMSGRGMGDCNPRVANRRDYGQGRRASGMGRRCYWADDYNQAYNNPVDDKEYLEREQEAIKARLEEISEMLEDIGEEE